MSDNNTCPCSPSCPLQEVLSSIGGKWKLPILCTLMVNGPGRYNALLKSTHGISNTMLSQTLKELESDRLVQRNVYPEVPVRVEYSLTDKAVRLRPILEELIQWHFSE